MKAAGETSFDAIVMALNARGIRTARVAGGNSSTVRLSRERA
jgi:hypothetical protein